jgi:hypothetical protein
VYAGVVLASVGAARWSSDQSHRDTVNAARAAARAQHHYQIVGCLRGTADRVDASKTNAIDSLRDQVLEDEGTAKARQAHRDSSDQKRAVAVDYYSRTGLAGQPSMRTLSQIVPQAPDVLAQQQAYCARVYPLVLP